MSNISQCKKGWPVGASESNIITAKLFVPAGGSVQESSGETLPPVQPKLSKSWASAIVAPGFMSSLFNSKACAEPPESKRRERRL